MNITIAITGASGTIYARELLKLILQNKAVEKVWVVATDNGVQVAQYELGQFPWWDMGSDNLSSKIELLDNKTMFTAIASGSSPADAMVVVPCSMGTLARIATGVSMDLVGRAADVMLKEGRKLVVCPRESPLSLIHLRNMCTLKEAGAEIVPLCPTMYNRPQSIEQLSESMADRILSSLGIPRSEAYKWGDEK